MPTTSMRKTGVEALKRFKEKYIQVEDKSNPYHLYIPNKKATDELRKLMNTRNYLRMLTQLDKNLFIMAEYYYYCEGDMWMCGDATVFNVNPDKHILVKPMCSARRDPCVCYDESSKEFLSCCPQCKKVATMILDTRYKCKCGFTIPAKRVNDMPYAKIPCHLCPRDIGWVKTQKLKDAVFAKLMPRQHIIQQNQNKEMEDIRREFGNGDT